MFTHLGSFLSHLTRESFLVWHTFHARWQRVKLVSLQDHLLIYRRVPASQSSVSVGTLARVLPLAFAHLFLPLLRISGSLDRKRRDKAVYHSLWRNSDAALVGLGWRYLKNIMGSLSALILFVMGLFQRDIYFYSPTFSRLGWPLVLSRFVLFLVVLVLMLFMFYHYFFIHL